MRAFLSNDREPIEIFTAGRKLGGILSVPNYAQGIVLFAHGRGSGRFSSRNHQVSGELQESGLATLLFDLLDASEAIDRTKVLSIPLLAQRLIDASDWVARQEELAHLPLGYFGASTGAGAALFAAASQGHKVRAIVSRGGQPDLAQIALARVSAPTLLIVGGNDESVVELNRLALASLTCEKRLTIVPGATHLFDEPGKLQTVARLAAEWFRTHLTGQHDVPNGFAQLRQ